MRSVAMSHHGTEAIGDAMLIMACAFDAEYGEAWSDAQCRGVLAMPGSTLIVARGTTPLGFALVRTIVGEAELMLLAVAPEHRGCGIGRQLVVEACRMARGKAAEILFLEVRADNPAICLYSALGFQEVGRRKSYYRGSGGKLRDALTLRIDLETGPGQE